MVTVSVLEYEIKFLVRFDRFKRVVDIRMLPLNEVADLAPQIDILHQMLKSSRIKFTNKNWIGQHLRSLLK